jgi:hypothetical protein
MMVSIFTDATSLMLDSINPIPFTQIGINPPTIEFDIIARIIFIISVLVFLCYDRAF